MPYSDYEYGYDYPISEITKESEIMFLKEQAEFMQKEISAVNERIRELESLASDQKDR
jgi:hypothetical protein